jgi:hypothetical protein
VIRNRLLELNEAKTAVNKKDRDGKPVPANMRAKEKNEGDVESERPKVSKTQTMATLRKRVIAVPCELFDQE